MLLWNLTLSPTSRTAFPAKNVHFGFGSLQVVTLPWVMQLARLGIEPAIRQSGGHQCPMSKMTC